MFKQLFFIIGLYAINSTFAFSQSESAFQLVKAKTINSNLAQQFPVTKSFKGTAAIFSDARILIDPLEQSAKLQMTVAAKDAQQTLVATLVFSGTLQYDPFSEFYQFEKPQLTSFKIEQDSYTDSLPTVKVIKQTLINNFDDISLFNLTEVNAFAPKRPADKIEMLKDKLRFVWY